MNAISANDTAMPAAISRRFLLAAPIVAVGAAAPVMAVESETPVMALFREWERLWNYSHAPEISDDEHAQTVDAFCAVERDMKNVRCQTPQDWIAKAIATSSFGDFGLYSQLDDPELWAEARALVA